MMRSLLLISAVFPAYLASQAFASNWVESVLGTTGSRQPRPEQAQPRPMEPQRPVAVERPQIPKPNQPQYALSKGIHRVWTNVYQDCQAVNYEIGCAHGQNCQVSHEPFNGIRRIAEAQATYPPRQVVDPSALRATHPNLRQRNRQPPADIPGMCGNTDRYQVLPTCFSYSSHAQFDPETGAMAINAGVGNRKDRDHEDPSQINARNYGLVANRQLPAGEDNCRTVSCSGYVSAALLAAGLKIYKDDGETRGAGNSAYTGHQINTETMVQLFNGSHPRAQNSCLQSPSLKLSQLDGSETMPPMIFGDGAGHSFILEEQKGGDPFGVAKALSAARRAGSDQSCKDIPETDLNFKISQSAAMLHTVAGSIGMSRSHIRARLGKRDEETEKEIPGEDTPIVYERFRNALVTIARKMCLSLYRNNQESVDVKPFLMELNQQIYADTPDNLKNRRGFFMLVPNGEDPACLRKSTVKMEGDSCAKHCASG